MLEQRQHLLLGYFKTPSEGLARSRFLTFRLGKKFSSSVKWYRMYNTFLILLRTCHNLVFTDLPDVFTLHIICSGSHKTQFILHCCLASCWVLKHFTTEIVTSQDCPKSRHVIASFFKNFIRVCTDFGQQNFRLFLHLNSNFPDPKLGQLSFETKVLQKEIVSVLEI